MQEISATQDSPEEFIGEKFWNTAFSDQAIGRPITGTLDTIQNFHTNEFQRYIDKHYRAENMYLSIAGDISHDQAVTFGNKLFNSPKSANIRYEFAPALYTPSSCFIKKDLEQSTLLLGFNSISYVNIKDSYIVYMLGLILGGSMSSRLFQRIRENLGLVYSNRKL